MQNLDQWHFGVVAALGGHAKVRILGALDRGHIGDGAPAAESEQGGPSLSRDGQQEHERAHHDSGDDLVLEPACVHLYIHAINEEARDTHSANEEGNVMPA